MQSKREKSNHAEGAEAQLRFLGSMAVAAVQSVAKRKSRVFMGPRPGGLSPRGNN
jgi:hypothetical protein